MEEKIIVNYNSILDKFAKIINETKNDALKIYIKEQYQSFIMDLAKREKKEIKHYEEMLKKVDIEEYKIVKILEEIKVKSNIYTYELDSNVMNLNEISKTESKSDDLEEYILKNIYQNKDVNISDRHQKLCLKLQSDFKSPNELLIKTWLKNYMVFVNDYDKELDREKLIDYMKLLFKKYDKDGIYYNNLDSYIKDIENDSTKDTSKNEEVVEKKQESKDNVKSVIEPLKILNIKKSTLSKTGKNTIKALGLIGVASVFGLPATILTYVVYKLYKRLKKPNKKLIDFIKQEGYSINEENELVDNNGNIVTDNVIEREKTNFLKNKLMNLKNPFRKGNISDSYKKNKLASMILDTKYVKRLKDKFAIFENDKKVKTLEQKDMHNGMGKC